MADLRLQIEKNRVFITEQIRYCDISDYLRQELDLFTIHHDELIQSIPVNRDRMSKCLDVLQNAGPNAPTKFMEAISSISPGVVEKIRNTEVNMNEEAETVILEGEVTPRALNKLCGNVHVLDNWKVLARTLGVNDADIKTIVYANRDDLKGQVYQMFTTWQGQNRRCDATKQVLYQALVTCKLNLAADDFARDNM